MSNRNFIRVKFGGAEKPMLINVNDIRAVAQLDDDRFHIWLQSELTLPDEVMTRLSKLGGVSPVKAERWTVYSSDLRELFEG